MGNPNPLAYAAEPIDQAENHLGLNLETWRHQWRHAIAETSQVCTIYRPSTAFRATDPDTRIERINRYALRRADLILACLPAGVPTIGVPAEIEYGTRMLGIPAVVLTEIRSQVLAGNSMVYTVQDPSEVKKTVIEALDTHARPHQVDIGHLVSVVVDPEQRLPDKAYPDDAGFDLTVVGDHTIGPGEFKDLPSQVRGVHLPEQTWLMITGRSSTLRRLGLHVPVAVIDCGWRGPLLTGIWNLGTEPVRIGDGDRLAQAILLPAMPHRIVSVTDVPDHPRGLRGFGSTGTGMVGSTGTGTIGSTG